MKKTYEPETKSAIEQVIDVFNDYIRTSTHFELLWSDKVGYIYISIDNVQGSIGDTGCCVVNCGEELFDKSYGNWQLISWRKSVIPLIPPKQRYWSAEKLNGGSILIWSSCPLIKIDYSAFLQGRKTD